MSVLFRPLRVSVPKTRHYYLSKTEFKYKQNVRRRESILCQKKYIRGHLVEGSLGHIFFKNAKFDLKGKKIDPLDCFFSQIIINLKNIYIYYKFIA